MSKTLKLPLQTQQASKILKATAENSSRVIFTHHAIERMCQRGISQLDVLRILKTARITKGPSEEANGSWKMTIEGISAGSLISAVVVIDYHHKQDEDDCYSIIITAYH